MKILINECKQEISSFHPFLGVYEDFNVSFGNGVLDAHRGVGSEVGGAIQVFESRPDVEIVPGYSARAITSGGTLKKAAFDRIATEFLSAVRSAASSIDAVYFSLHGALASEDVHDAEGYLTEKAREIIGPKMPLVVSLDLHGILTDRILEHSDAMTVYHTYPHVDFYETGQRAARLLLKILDGKANPVSIRLPIPALVRGYELITSTGMFGRCVSKTIAFENSADGLSGGMFIGNPFTDVPDLCSNVFLVTNGDVAKAECEAASIAKEFWSMREHLQQPLTGLEESIRIALSLKGKAGLVDAADATSSGAPGDSNAIIRALMEAKSQRTALIPIVDAPTAEAAFRAGVGATIQSNVGGTLDPRHQPLKIEGKVRLLCDGKIRSESHNSYWHAGPTAVLECGSITLVVTSRPVSLYDRSLFYATGQDPQSFDMVVIKSPHCQPQFFSDHVEKMINIDAPGATSANLTSLGHTICQRPIFPLDQGVTFDPKPKHFTRNHYRAS